MRLILFLALLCPLIIDITAAQDSLMIAQNDGTLGVGWSEISGGIFKGNNFFYSTLPDNISDKLGRYVFFEVIMGNFTDYIIPALKNKGAMRVYELYNVLGGGVRVDNTNMRAHSYSPVSPLDELFDGSSTAIPNSGPTIYGSSPKGFVHDGNRNVLNGWGSIRGARGGCGFLNKKDTFGGKRPYTIIAHKFSVDYVYLGLKYTPPFYYSGQKINIVATVRDIFGRDNIPETSCTWTLKRNDTSKTSSSQGSAYKVDLDEIKIKDTLLLNLDVSMKAPGNKKFWSASESTSKNIQIIMPYHEIKSNGTLLESKAPVTRMLRFSNPADPTDAMKATVADSESLQSSFFDEGDHNIRPRNEQPMTAKNKDARDQGKTYHWVWKDVSSSNGVFGAVSASKTHQYFAFAFHNPIKQVINVIFECADKANCAVYVNGNKPTDGEYQAGWYQVIIRIASDNPIASDKGFKISFEAYSLVLSHAIRDVAPYETEPVTTTITGTTTATTKGTTTGTITATTTPTRNGSTTTISPPEHDAEETNNKGKTTGIIVGCIVGAIVLIGLIVLTVFLLKRNAKVKQEKVITDA